MDRAPARRLLVPPAPPGPHRPSSSEGTLLRAVGTGGSRPYRPVGTKIAVHERFDFRAVEHSSLPPRPRQRNGKTETRPVLRARRTAEPVQLGQRAALDAALVRHPRRADAGGHFLGDYMGLVTASRIVHRCSGSRPAKSYDRVHAPHPLLSVHLCSGEGLLEIPLPRDRQGRCHARLPARSMARPLPRP